MSELSSLRGSERYEVCDDDIPHSVFSFLHRRGAFFLFDKPKRKNGGRKRVLSRTNTAFVPKVPDPINTSYRHKTPRRR